MAKPNPTGDEPDSTRDDLERRPMTALIGSHEFPETHPSLLEAIQGSNAGGGWIEFYKRYSPAVFRVARFRGMDRHDAEDVVQQVMLSISRHIDDFQYDRSRGMFRNWIRRIAENRIIDVVRRQSRTVTTSDTVPEQADSRMTLDDVWDREWRLQDVLYCIDECRKIIAPRTYEAFRMYAIEGMDAKKVADTLRMSVEQVYVTRNQVLKRVKALMTELNTEPS